MAVVGRVPRPSTSAQLRRGQKRESPHSKERFLASTGTIQPTQPSPDPSRPENPSYTTLIPCLFYARLFIRQDSDSYASVCPSGPNSHGNTSKVCTSMISLTVTFPLINQRFVCRSHTGTRRLPGLDMNLVSSNECFCWHFIPSPPGPTSYGHRAHTRVV
jgi:hypothetical protein